MKSSNNPPQVSRNRLVALVTAGAATFGLALAVGSGPVAAEETTEPETAKVRIANYSPFFQKLGEDRVINIAKVRCVVGTCQVDGVTKARAYVRGKKFGLDNVTYPTEPLEAGQVGEVTAVLPEAAVERLGGTKRVGKAWLRLQASATLNEVTKTHARAVSRGFRLGKVPKESKSVNDRPKGPNR